MRTLLAIALFSLPLFATDTTTPIPYRWGEFQPVPVTKGKRTRSMRVAEAWNSDEGRRRFERSHYKEDFFQLANEYQPQATPVYAGVATAVTILNALRLPVGIPSQREQEITKPKVLGGGVIPYPVYNQINFFNERTDAVKDRRVLGLQNVTSDNENDKKNFRPGTSLEELKALFAVYGVNAERVDASEAEDVGVRKFRTLVKQVLADKKRFLVANFLGTTLGAPTEGTVSPLAAYDPKTDSVLVLDVTLHKNPWYWADLASFYAAMHTQYGEGTWRGYLVVRGE